MNEDDPFIFFSSKWEFPFRKLWIYHGIYRDQDFTTQVIWVFLELVLRSAAMAGWVQLLEVGANLGDCALWTAAHLGRPWLVGMEESESYLPNIKNLVVSKKYA